MNIQLNDISEDRAINLSICEQTNTIAFVPTDPELDDVIAKLDEQNRRALLKPLLKMEVSERGKEWAINQILSQD